VLLSTQDPNGDPRFFNPLGLSEDYVRKLKNLGVKSNDPPLPGESTACLLMAMEKAIGGPGKLADTFGANCIKKQSFPTTGGGQVDVDVLKDDWGTPMQFYRWTTNPAVDALAPASKTVIRNPSTLKASSTTGPGTTGGTGRRLRLPIEYFSRSLATR
jgi:hypothetical protein